MKNLFIAFVFLFPALAFGQFGLGSPNRTLTELGRQTTARGIVYYAPGPPNTVITWRVNRDTAAYMWVDTSTSRRYEWNHVGNFWVTQGVISGASNPPATFTNGPALIDNRDAFFRNTTDSLFYFYDYTNLTWAEFGSGGGATCGDCPVTVSGPIAGDGTTADPLNLKGYDEATDGQYAVKNASTGFDWITVGLDTFAIVSNTLRASIYGDNVPFKSVSLAPYLDNTDAQNLTINGTSAPYVIAISGGSDVEVDEGIGISLSESPANTLVITNSAPDQTVSITGAGINAVTGTYPNFTVTGTEADGSVSNEGTLGVGAGSGTSSTLTTNTSGGNAVTINAAGILTISESTSSNGGSITLTGTEVDGSTTNEIQALTAGDGAGDNKTLDLSLSGGTVTLDPAGIFTIGRTANTLTMTATEVDGVVTNEGVLGVGAGGANDALLTSNTSGATGTTIAGGTGLTVTESTSANGGTITLTPVDQSATNELQTLSVASNTTTLSNSGGSMTIAGAGINTVATAGTTITVTGTEVDGSVTNEGTLGVGAGGANTALLTSNTSGATGTTIAGGTGITITESTSANGGTITITNSGTAQTLTSVANALVLSGDGSVLLNGSTGITISTPSTSQIDFAVADQSATNELQTLSVASNTTTLSNSGGSMTIAGAGINTVATAGTTITVTGTEVDGSNTNELQNLSLTGQALGISSGSGVTLPIVGVSAGTGISVSTSSGVATVTNTGDTNASDDITNSTTAGGDLSGTYPNPTVDGLQGVSVSATSPTTGQVLKYNGSAWAPGTDATGGGGGGVASVTGPGVDNTDVANPVVNARPYKVYTALLTQSGTSAPVATVLENTLGGTVTWNYEDVGDYSATLTGAFTTGKTWIIVGTDTATFSTYHTNPNSVGITSPAGNGALSSRSIEIRIYP